MIQATELRVGNYIQNDLQGRILEILSVSGDLVFIEENPQNYSPIPLTKEWLLRFGLEKLDTVTWKITTGIFIRLPEQGDMWDIYRSTNNRAGDFSGLGIRRIRCVHELQNLYFALTGQELTISTPQQA